MTDADSIAIARLEERVDNLEGWQKTQNGTLLRLDEKIGKIDEKIGSLKTWLISLLGGMLASLALQWFK